MIQSLSFRHVLWKTNALCLPKNEIIQTSFRRQLSTKSKPWYYENPSQVVSGISTEDLDNDPDLAAYFAANFPERPPSLEQYHHEQEKQESFAALSAVEHKEEEALRKLNIRPLFCHPRDKETEEGSRVCRRIREYDRMIPGLLYGQHPASTVGVKDNRIFVKTPLSEIQREHDRYFHHFTSRVYNLTIRDPESSDIISQEHVVPSDFNMHPVLNKAYCVNYLRYHPGRVLRIPVQYINQEESPALKRGGFIIPINKYVKVLVEDGVAIPESIELDCTGARIKEQMRLDRLIIPDGVRVCKSIDKESFLIGPVFGKGIKSDDEDEDDEAV